MTHIVEETIAGPHGSLRVRTYTPGGRVATSTGLVWVHGGAFAFGDLDMPEADWVSKQIAETGSTVVSVDYQLASTGRAFGLTDVDAREGVLFPVASEEVGGAFEWAVGQARLGVPGDRWSLGGASAGANLCAGAALRLRDQGSPQPRSLVLAYPLVHSQLPPHRAELAEKVAALPEDARFRPATVREINLNYVGGEATLASRYAFPGTHDLQGLPPTFILNSDADDLRSSGEQFAAELAAAGVDLLMIRENDTRHGHLDDPQSPGAQRSVRRIVAWLASLDLVGTRHEGPSPENTDQSPTSPSVDRVTGAFAPSRGR